MDSEQMIDGLPPERRETIAKISAQIAARIANLNPQTQQYVFPAAPLDGHVWEDDEIVFFLTVREFARALQPGEFPLLFIGADAQNRFTKKRESLGFLLTDRAILVMNVRSIFSSTNDALVFPLTDPSAAANASAAFDWDFWTARFRREGADPAQMRAELTHVLADAASIVNSAMAVSSVPIPVRQTAADISGRLRELGLVPHVKLGTDPKQAKHLAKLSAKAGVPSGERIVVAISDATFAGPYGTVITDSHVCSRDLMEDPVPPTPRTAVDPANIVVSKDVLTLGPGQVHTLPNNLDESAQKSLEIFLKELFSGTLIV